VVNGGLEIWPEGGGGSGERPGSLAMNGDCLAENCCGCWQVKMLIKQSS